jgi:hypothetical protein
MIILRGDSMAMLNKINMDNYFIGRVLEINKTTREVSVHISQLMPAIASEASQVIQSQTTNNLKISGVDYSGTLKLRNSFWVKPNDYDEPLPKIGSKVSVKILDGNPRLSFWDKFNPNNNYEVIDEEKYPKSFDFSVGNKQVQINKDDKISIILPENFTTVLNEEEKDKIFRLYEKNLYVISEKKPENVFEGLL